jgi:hypothetical protein
MALLMVSTAFSISVFLDAEMLFCTVPKLVVGLVSFHVCAAVPLRTSKAQEVA